MCDIPTADIDIKLSNEVDRLWDAAVTRLDHFLQFVALCNIITFVFYLILVKTNLRNLIHTVTVIMHFI